MAVSTAHYKKFTYNSCTYSTHTLPEDIKRLNSIEKFKSQVKSFLLHNCFYTIRDYTEHQKESRINFNNDSNVIIYHLDCIILKNRVTSIVHSFWVDGPHLDQVFRPVSLILEQMLRWSLVLLLDINVTSLFVHVFWISVGNIVIQIIVFHIIAAKSIILSWRTWGVQAEIYS